MLPHFIPHDVTNSLQQLGEYQKELHKDFLIRSKSITRMSKTNDLSGNIG